MKSTTLKTATMLIISLSLPFQSFATLTPDFPRGEEIIKFEVGSGKAPEICVLPKHLPGGDYDEKDLKNEKELCSLDVTLGGTQNTVACPKKNSTNPGVLFYQPQDGATLKQVIDTECTYKDKDGDTPEKVAKYKQSTSCSYTPSILGYYHMSRVLGDIVNVPPSVVRTMDLSHHIALGERALQTTKVGDLINQTWQGLMSNLKAGKNSSKKDLLFTDNFDQSYGALQKNPKREEFYKEFYNPGTDRVLAFRENNVIYRALTNPALNVGRVFNQKNVQDMVQLKDAADMILIDTILGQQDRFGNIHYINRYYYQTDESGVLNVKNKKDQKDVPTTITGSSFAIKEMMLKDDDCGVVKENRIKAARLLDRISHMSPKTYRHLLDFAKLLDNPDIKPLFTRGFMFTETDFKTVIGNYKEAVSLLQGKCKAGQLKLDLDLDTHFSGQTLPTTFQCI